jgi:hypothetical protein
MARSICQQERSGFSALPGALTAIALRIKYGYVIHREESEHESQHQHLGDEFRSYL